MAAVKRWPLVPLAVVGLLAGARVLRVEANAARGRWPASAELPSAPSARMSPFISLGYRELLADLLWIKTIGYVGGDDDRAEGTRKLIEAIIALDPSFQRPYGWGALAISSVGVQATNDDLLAAIRILEQGMARFPDSYELPLRAGQIYTVDLQTDDPEQRRQWQIAGARMLERAVRIPGAPRDVATFAAFLRTQVGQRDKAVRDLRELILYTQHGRDRDALIRKLAELESGDAATLDHELELESKRFERAWQATRPELPPTQFLLVGPPLAPRFRLEDLAVDRDLIGSEETVEPLPPLGD